MLITSIKINEIQGYHESIDKIVAATTSRMYRLGPHECSQVLLTNLLKLHPVHIVNSEQGYLLIAGFRTYEIACLLLEDNQKIECLLHDMSKLTKSELMNLALSDIVGTSALFNFSENSKQQLKEIKRLVGKEQVNALFKEISSKQKIDARMFGVNLCGLPTCQQ